MRMEGIHDDVGTPTLDGSTTRPVLPADVIEREIADLADGLCASAVRVTGGRPRQDRTGR